MATRSHGSRRHGSVTIVDDDPSIRRSVGNLLRSTKPFHADVLIDTVRRVLLSTDHTIVG